MILANERLVDINVTNFAQLKSEVREKFERNLKQDAGRFLNRKVKDYREVIGNLTKRLMSGR